VTDLPEEVTEEAVQEVTEEVTEQAPAEELAEPQAEKPNALNAIINNPVWLALAFLTLIVITLVVFR
jgi:hypothetical protein